MTWFLTKYSSLVLDCRLLIFYLPITNAIAFHIIKEKEDTFNCIWLTWVYFIYASIFHLCMELVRNIWNILIKSCIALIIRDWKRDDHFLHLIHIAQRLVMRSYEGDISHHDMAASKSYIKNLRKHKETVKKQDQAKTYNVQ